MEVRTITSILISAAFLCGCWLGAAEDTKAPETIVFEAKNGNVTFHHQKHGEREKGDCKSCHPGLFPQKKGAPLNYKAAMHKPAEAKKISCAGCHVAGGKAFAATGNCAKCHVKGAAKS